MIKYLIFIVLMIFNCRNAMAEISNDSSYVMGGEPVYEDTFNFEVQSGLQSNINFPSCAQDPPELETCTPYVCKVKAEFGEIFVKVKGMVDGKCQYIERTFGLDGINCQFKMDKIVAIESLFAKRFKKLSGSRTFLLEPEYQGLARIFKTECTIVPDYNLSKLIPLNKINTNEVDPELNIEDLAKYANIIKHPDVPVLKESEVIDLDYKANLDNYRSIMLIDKHH